MTRFIALATVAAILVTTSTFAVAQSKPKPPPAQSEKVDIVAVAGCLKEPSPGTWTLTNAADPVASSANAPSPKELASLGKSGKNEFRLIGVSEFNLAAHRGHTVVIKGLHIKATPMSRLNVTSVTMVSADCPPSLRQ
ncbi:MAG TPA: hypothetical protein VEK56_14100 [Vicinamibacterales bacterium]|nr:hypothetical protein [Vicinamibacterales bacterium]